MGDQQRSDIVFRPYQGSDFELIWCGVGSSFNGKLEFYAWLERTRSRYQEFLIVEIDGVAIAFVGAYFDGWKYEPHVEFFNNSTKRQKLNSSVEFFKRLSGLDTIGVVIVKCLYKSCNLFDHVSRKVGLEYIGRIEKGDYRGTEYIYSIAGLAVRPTTIQTPTIGRI